MVLENPMPMTEMASLPIHENHVHESANEASRKLLANVCEFSGNTG